MHENIALYKAHMAFQFESSQEPCMYICKTHYHKLPGCGKVARSPPFALKGAYELPVNLRQLEINHRLQTAEGPLHRISSCVLLLPPRLLQVAFLNVNLLSHSKEKKREKMCFWSVCLRFLTNVSYAIKTLLLYSLLIHLSIPLTLADPPLYSLNIVSRRQTQKKSATLLQIGTSR